MSVDWITDHLAGLKNAAFWKRDYALDGISKRTSQARVAYKKKTSFSAFLYEQKSLRGASYSTHEQGAEQKRTN